MHSDDSPARSENQAPLQREAELKLEVAATRLRAAKAEYRLAMLKLITADPSLTQWLSEVYRRDTGEELLPEPIQESSHVETS